MSYSGSQKCLGAPPGAAPFTMGPRAREKLASRKTKVESYYFDMNEARRPGPRTLVLSPPCRGL